MDRSSIVQITPFFGVAELRRSVQFYTDILGFSAFVHAGDYAYIERDGIGIRLLELNAGASSSPGSGHAYVDVHDIDSLFAEMELRLKTLPVERWDTPQDQHYGQREFWVRDPDGNLLNFGQGIGPNAAQWEYRQ